MSTFLLKLIALLVMIVDHTGVVFQPLFDVSLLRCIGRIAFPIFLFFVSEGCRRTRNIKLYMLRLGMFALISELPYDLATASIRIPASGSVGIGALDFMGRQNVFFTLFLGALCVYIFQMFYKSSKQYIYIILIPFVIYLGDVFHTDYGSLGVMFVFILYILPYGVQEAGKPLKMSSEGKFFRLAAIFCLLTYLYIYEQINFYNAGSLINAGGFSLLLERRPEVISDYSLELMLFSCISIFLLTFYNNKRGASLRWLFYASYPVHLLILGIIRFLYVIPKVYH